MAYATCLDFDEDLTRLWLFKRYISDDKVALDFLEYGCLVSLR